MSQQAKHIAFVLAIQSALFCAVGGAMHVFASSAAKDAIPVCNFGPALSIAVFGTAGFVLMLFSNVGLSWIFTNASKAYRIASIESAKFFEEVLDLGRLRVLMLAVASLSEEVLFRFGLLPFAAGLLMMLGTSPITALCASLVITSLAFCALHFQYGNAGQLVQVLLAGAVLGAVYLATGNLIVIWFVHFLVNVVALKIEPAMEAKARQKFPQDYGECA